MKTKTILTSIAFAMFVSVPVSAQYKYAWQNPNLPPRLPSLIPTSTKVTLCVQLAAWPNRLR